MLNKIIHFSINNKLVIGLFTLGLIAWGIWSLKKLPIDAVPDITNNQVQVITLSPSLATQEVERLISYPVEQTMATIPEIEQVRSISRFGLSVVTIVFHDDVDIYWARQQVNEKLAEAKNNIPAGLGNPEISPISTGLGEIYQYVIHAKPGYETKYNARELRSIQDWIVRRQLLGTPGIAEVNSFGGLLKQYEIALDPDKLRSFNLSITNVFDALEQNNQNTGGAYIDKKPNAYFIRSEGLVGSTDDIGKIVVKNNTDGTPVLIRDISVVKIGNSIRYGALTRASKENSGEAVGGIVMMLKGANANNVVKAVKEKIARINTSLPQGVVVESFLDRSALVGRAIGTVEKNLIEGALIVIFVLVIFLGNLRAGLVVASVIPLAMLFAICMMNLFGVSGNLMSLGAIDFGLIVDGAVIIVEATMHLLYAKERAKAYTQQEMNDQVETSAVRMMSAAAFGQIIILIVYFPILALVGIEGKMFRPMAETVAFAIIGAFLLSLTYVPMISSMFLSKKPKKGKNFSDKMMDAVHKRYEPMIKGALNHRMPIIIVSVVLLAAAVFTFTRMGGEFIPTLEEGDFAVETRLLTGSSLSQTIDKVNQASQILVKKFPEVKEVIGKIGAAEIPTDPMPMDACDLTVILKDKKEWTTTQDREELANLMAKELESVPGVTFGFSQPIQLRSNELISGVRQDIGIKIFGDDLQTLAELSQKVGKIVSSVSGAKDLYIEQATGLPQIVVKIDRDKVAQYGLSVSTVNQAINAAFAGQSAGLVYEGERRYDMVVRLSDQNRQNIDDVKNLYVTAPNGNQVPLEQLASVQFQVGPNQIQREDTKRRIVVGLNVRGRDIQSVVTEIQAKINQQIKMPAGYYVTYGGQFENLKEATARLSVAVPVALLLILLLLYFSFGSIKQSVLIFSAIPMAAIGGVFALLLRGMPFSISAGVGFIALFGVAVLNGIVLITEFNRLKKSGLTDLKKIVLEGTAERLRPVLMTATVASLGFMPMAISSAAGAEVQKPLATVVIGGLITSTILTLIVLPVLYTYFENFGKKRKAGKTAKVVASLLLLLGFCLPSAKAQNRPAPGQPLTLEQAISTASANNFGVKASQLEISQQTALKGSSVDLGKTNFNLQYGQFNSIKRDNQINITQSIPFPGLFKSQRQVYEAQEQNARIGLNVTQSQLRYQVRQAFGQLAYFTALSDLYLRQDSIYNEFFRAASVRFKAGESNLLEKTTAETQLNEVRNQRSKNSGDIAAASAELQRLMNTSDSVSLVSGSLKRASAEFKHLDSAINQNPQLAYQRQQVILADRTISLEKAKSGPDFTVGYFNQSIMGIQNVNGTDQNFTGANRFQGIQAGVSIPLFFKPFAARVKAARIQKEVSQTQLQLYEKNLSSQYEQSYHQLLKSDRSVSYYESSALPNAELILKQAQIAFRNGEISYVEFVQALKTASDIRLAYLQALNQYNQSVYDLQYLTGL
ncbi:CusA/CzcA family heavy metal efflux RND transporter [Mucilaginibacter rubeus]|uniref:CusA/CzcA family heavy metal efflux RND transporter n=1 Tax=Mucilaginibacter rubeus TaxID=2027860 RepID=A0AAE6JDJ9_9SPHI|nr:MULTISPECIES: CusA/CzcA family heavy metal efflux RND transporter [Mucilaginibacter]QEM03672.1 CusA/CzcA family heavy metal efflux RND transporter [Mucilaginibacter rubeus]QEM16283.1 CusA/CzcA family heavy metal efflux RND transporter [Mucilaginibacter gossypii]QTE40955.1 CusA/CzcA family heavy metal efflux RND transporter [Mucilaginibacter rubeus]QTE47558.1 CusA/CzcA family heavy metal efflux RND transporter [Mucilaginibacter rubeus]QTE58950.1 CusA/CzcA family heavy metal efflux RND transp